MEESNLPKSENLTMVELKESKDGSIKFLFETLDDRYVESIYFPFSGLFNRKLIKARVLCLSSQVGCPIGCEFCATGKIDNPRNLTLGEITDQFLLTSKEIQTRRLELIDSLAMMGMGEPLLNLDNVLSFASTASKISDIERFSVSTVGLTPKIKRLRELNNTIKLYLSVHTPFNTQRAKIIPVSKVCPIDEVVKECLLFAIQSRRTVVANYILIKGVNDSIEHIHGLAKLLDPNYFDIQLNIWNKISGVQFQQSDLEHLQVFSDILTREGYVVDVQLSKGTDIAGGCGQFSAKKSVLSRN